MDFYFFNGLFLGRFIIPSYKYIVSYGIIVSRIVMIEIVADHILSFFRSAHIYLGSFEWRPWLQQIPHLRQGWILSFRDDGLERRIVILIIGVAGSQLFHVEMPKYNEFEKLIKSKWYFRLVYAEWDQVDYNTDGREYFILHNMKN